jgi:hypothetical protein
MCVRGIHAVSHECTLQIFPGNLISAPEAVEPTWESRAKIPTTPMQKSDPVILQL